MPRRFAQLTFTSSVKAAQEHYGTRAHNERYEASETGNTEFGPRERQFIEACDSFFLATVSEDGWPYVQHRGGRAGFLQVVDATTLAFADFRGNLQYQSIGNLRANDHVCLILVDYRQRRRLKLLGQAEVFDLAVLRMQAPSLLDQLHGDDVATAERVLRIKLAAFDWNCSRHIPLLYSADELNSSIIPLQQRIAQLEGELRQLGGAPA